MARQAATYRFGPYDLRTRTRELYKHGTKLKLRAQPFQVLQALVERAGDVITREELRDLLWPEMMFVDFQHGLNAAISELRATLNDTASEPRYIETLPKVGYRIKVPVEVVETAGTASETADLAVLTTRGEGTETAIEFNGPAVKVNRGWKLSIGISLLALLGIVEGYLQWTGARVHPQAMNGRVMLAVLPFQNLTGDAGQEFFSDGLTEEMIAQLGRLDPAHLGVIARSSVEKYKEKPEQVEKVNRELGVQYILEGSVRRGARNVRITAELVQTKDQTHVWAREYDRDISDLLALQAEIAKDIANEIRLTLGVPKPIEVAAAPVAPKNMETYELYLKGRYFWNKRTLAGFQKAIEYFDEAIRKDPQNARAYAGLADTYALMSGYAGMALRDHVPKAHAAARRAIELDEKLAEAHTSMAVVAQNLDWDWITAEKEYRRAIELDPNFATAHHWYAEYLALMGRFDEAFVEIERARQLDPLSLIIASDHGAILYYSRQYDRAIEQFRAVREMDPSFSRASLVVAAYNQEGRYEDSLADLKKWPEEGVWNQANTAYSSGRLGREGDAKRALEELRRLERSQHVDPLAFVVADLGLGRNGEAMASLENAYEEHSPALTGLKVDPIYDPLRNEPRFQELLRRLRMPE